MSTSKRNPFLREFIFCLLLTVMMFLTCAVNPVTGKKEFSLLTESDEIALGQQTDQEIIQQYGLYEDEKLNAYLEQLGKKMTINTHRPNLPYSFKVLDTPVVNAFAVPGGYIYFTRGILANLNNEAEIAGVMGHELGHVAARHTAQQYTRATLAQLGLGVGAMLSETFRKYAGLASFGVQLLFLKFSRDNERQADDLGVEYSVKTGFDSDAMADFFETLERMNPGSSGSGLPEWFSTHPNPENRVQAVKQKTLEWEQKLNSPALAMNRNEYLDKIDGIIYGEDPNQGYVDSDVFYHPGLLFQFPVPSGWKVYNTPSQLQIISQNEDAAVLLTVEQNQTPSGAAQTFIQNSQVTVQNSSALTVNGMQSQRMVSNLQSESESLQILSYFIQKEGYVYIFHGFTQPKSYNQYASTFQSSMQNFKKLTDQKRIKVTPNKLAVRTIKKQTFLRTALTELGVQEKNLEEAAIMNGMNLGDTVAPGTRLKVVLQ